MKLTPGSIAPALVARTILGQSVRIPSDGTPYLHLQFRRFAGCPVCNFHLRTMSLRQPEIAAAGVRQIVFFHSSPEEMLEYQAQLPFDCIADPTKRYYRAYGVETSWRAVLHPGVFWSGLRWVLSTGRFYRKAENGILGLPADFLIDARGRVVACKYGQHADDHWEVDDLLKRVGDAVAPPVSSAQRPGTVG
ncbi:peroxiredoxin-like family protein [Variovorax sp.]|jgi:peroxiredoxin|uniref:peroxiredoxin-like family protein n=1 Tax=Variovorax sp. TaxID=1871043 RepID=UPI0037DA4510